MLVRFGGANVCDDSLRQSADPGFPGAEFERLAGRSEFLQ
jgi:hypothetical protein